MFLALELNQLTQAPIAGPPHQARFQQGAAERLEVLADQFFALIFGQAGQAQSDIDGRDATVPAREAVGQSTERAPDGELRRQGQNVHGAHDPQAQPNGPKPRCEKAVERNTVGIARRPVWARRVR